MIPQTLPLAGAPSLPLGILIPGKAGTSFLRLAIEFPPGSTILIPSATLTHSNTAVQSHEARLYFTQYSAGGLFRWVDNGCMTEAELKASDEDAYDRMMESKETRWKISLGMYSKLEDLLEHV